MPTRVIVTGDRGWACAGLAGRLVERLRARYGDGLTVVAGPGGGVDRAVLDACERLGVACEAVGAEVGAFALSGAGSHYDRSAGERNQGLVDGGAAFAVVVHKYLRASRSTADLVRRCVAAGIAVYLVDADGAEPRRIWGA